MIVREFLIFSRTNRVGLLVGKNLIRVRRPNGAPFRFWVSKSEREILMFELL